MILGLTGRAGSGKDSVGEMLRREYGAALISFAAPLKALCRELFGLTDDQVNTLDGKETPDPRWAGPDGKARTPREILQLVGTEGIRAVDPDFWVKRALSTAALYLRAVQDTGHGAPLVVMTDVRFPNEAAAVHSAGGLMVRLVKLDGPGTAQAGHASEAGIDALDVDFELRAPNGGLALLFDDMRQVMRATAIRPLEGLR